MTKELKIEGMSCKHCVKHVTNALSDVDGVIDIKVSLENKNALVILNKEVADQTFIDAIDEVGYKVTEIK